MISDNDIGLTVNYCLYDIYKHIPYMDVYMCVCVYIYIFRYTIMLS